MSKQTPLQNIPAIRDGQTLITRDQARLILGGIAYITIIRLEQAGRLRSVRHTPSPKAKAFYRLADVQALAQTYFDDPSTNVEPPSPASTSPGANDNKQTDGA